MSFEIDELVPNTVRLTPKRGLFGQSLAVWITAQDLPIATYLWQIAVSRAAANQDEIASIVEARQARTGESYNAAFNALVLESGMFKLAEESPVDKLEVDKEVSEALKKKVEESGLSLDDYLKRELNI